jgi:hypothetical protein
MENDAVIGEEQPFHHQKQHPIGIDAEFVRHVIGNEKTADPIICGGNNPQEAVSVLSGKPRDMIGITVSHTVGAEYDLYDPIRSVIGRLTDQKRPKIFG